MLSLILIFLQSQLFAKELFEYGQSIRANGMGGAYTAIVDDEDAIFYNPAALSRIEGINWRVLDIGLGVPGLSLYQDLQNVGTVNGISSISGLYGKNIWLGFDGKTTIAFPYFSASGFSTGTFNLALHRPPFPSLDYSVFNDVGFIVGGAVPFSNIFSMGMSVKRITRSGGTGAFGPAELDAASSSTINSPLDNKGIGYGLDTGLLIKAPVVLSPTFSIAWQDVGSTAFNHVGGTTGPPRIKDNLTAGFGFSGSVPLLRFAAAFDYRHITDNDEQLGKKIHMGTEIGIGPFDLRAGFYQGYYTYGLGVDLFFMQLDAAMYKVEKGVYPGQTPAERIAVGLHFDLGFDPDFNLTSAGGKKRKLKQRR